MGISPKHKQTKNKKISTSVYNILVEIENLTGIGTSTSTIC